MRLLTLAVTPVSDGEMSFGPMTFGERTTVLLGPNGSGKTPTMKALMFALGHPTQFPQPIRRKCRSVILTFATDGRTVKIERAIADEVQATATNSDGSTLEFRNESSLSEWIFQILGIASRKFVGVSGSLVNPYMSVAGPAFLVGQDAGWSNYYVPHDTHRFVKDQRTEVVRWMLGLQPKNRPIDKRDIERARLLVGNLREQITIKRTALEALVAYSGEDLGESNQSRLLERRSALEGELQDAHRILQSMRSDENEMERAVGIARLRRDEILIELSNLRRRRVQMTEVQREVETELEALGENEVAAEVFRTYCTNSTCQFFRRPEESYGRRLLYLKDQLKDFDSAQSQVENEMMALTTRLTDAEASLTATARANTAALEESGAASAIMRLNQASQDLAQVGARLSRWQQMQSERAQLENLIEQERVASDDLESLKPNVGPRRDALKEYDVRKSLETRFHSWLRTLQTPNTGPAIGIDDELRPIVAGEVFRQDSSHSGSTRSRIVLAFHAAVLETSIEFGGNHPRLLVLDSPKQHELDASDLRAYLSRMYSVSAGRSPVQIIFSATDPEILPIDAVDTLWTPQHMHGKQAHFFSAIESPAEPTDSSGDAADTGENVG